MKRIFQNTTFLSVKCQIYPFKRYSRSFSKSKISELLAKRDFTPVLVPDEGHHSATLMEWYKKENDKIVADEELCEIDTPEYSYSVTAKFDGYLAKIIAKQGNDDIEPGDVLCYICEDEEDLEDLRSLGENETTEAKENFELNGWLEEIDEKYTKYTKVFIDEGFETLEELQTLDKTDLEGMGIKKGHAKVILSKLDR